MEILPCQEQPFGEISDQQNELWIQRRWLKVQAASSLSSGLDPEICLEFGH
jgi:hypothetical protein